MSNPVANVNILSDTWESLINKVNNLAFLMSFETMTANITGANTGNSSVSRIGQLWGTYGANTIVVTTGLRGGNVTASNNLPIVSNVDVYVAAGAAPIVKVGNSTIITTIEYNAVRVGNTASNATINTTAGVWQSNTTANAIITPTGLVVSNGAVNSSLTAAGLTTGVVGSNQTHLFAGANVSIGVSGASYGNSTVNTNVTQTGVVVANATHSSNIGVSGLNTTGDLNVGSNTALTGAVALANTLSVAGNTNLGNYVNIKTDYTVDVAANSDVGSNTTDPQLVYRFPKASFGSGKLTVQIRNGTNTQISEIVIAHNTSNAYITVYGTVSSPPSGNSSPLLATFTANINNANVELLVVQTQANSSIKLAGHLIKA